MENNNIIGKRNDLKVSEGDNSFFSKSIDVTPLQRLQEKAYNDIVERNNLVLDVVKELQPISKYSLAKKTTLAYSTTKRIIKEFEFCGLVHIKNSVGVKGRPMKLIYIEVENASS